MDEQDTPMERWPDDQLLRAAHEGDENAFRIFCVRCLPSLHRVLRWRCRQRGVPQEEVKDFANEVIYRALAQVRANVEENQPIPKVSPAWLFQIGHNIVVDWVRKNSCRATAYQAKAERTKAQAPSQDELDDYEEALERFNWLPPNEREILEQVLLNGLSAVEAGEQMGLAPWAAYKAYHRALEHLRDLIEQHGRIARDA